VGQSLVANTSTTNSHIFIPPIRELQLAHHFFDIGYPDMFVLILTYLFVLIQKDKHIFNSATTWTTVCHHMDDKRPKVYQLDYTLQNHSVCP